MILFGDRCSNLGPMMVAQFESIFDVEIPTSVKEPYHQSVKEIIGPESVSNSASSASGEILRLNFETCQN